MVTFGTHLYRIAVACRIVPDKPLVFDLSQDNIVKTALPGNTLSDADRRRQAAERDLEKRLAGTATSTLFWTVLHVGRYFSA